MVCAALASCRAVLLTRVSDVGTAFSVQACIPPTASAGYHMTFRNGQTSATTQSFSCPALWGLVQARTPPRQPPPTPPFPATLKVSELALTLSLPSSLKSLMHLALSALAYNLMRHILETLPHSYGYRPKERAFHQRPPSNQMRA